MPPYTDKRILRDKLIYSIENAAGMHILWTNKQKPTNKPWELSVYRLNQNMSCMPESHLEAWVLSSIDNIE